MTVELERVSIGGVWQYQAVTEGGGGGLPTGWTQDGADPANVDSNGGDLTVRDLISTGGVTVGGVAPGQVFLSDGNGNFGALVADDVDPTVGAGIVAHQGSLLLRTNGEAWLKTGAGNTDWTQLGTSTPQFARVRFPIAFDTPNLVLTGIPIYTPAVGDMLPVYVGATLNVTSAWDGSTPKLHFGYAGALTAYDAAFGLVGDLTQAAGAVGPHAVNPGDAGSNTCVVFTDATPVTAMVDDGSGGDPGSMQGEGEIVLVVVKP